MWVVNIRTVIVDDNEYQSERGLDIKIPGEYRVEDLQWAVALEGCQATGACLVGWFVWPALGFISNQKPPYFRGSTGAFVAWLRPVNYRCLTYSNPLGAFMSLKSVGSQTGSMRGPAGQRPSCTYKDEAMEFSQIQL